MCIKQFIDWFNNDFLFIFENKSYTFSKKSEVEIIIEEPKIELSNAKKQLEEYEDYSWDIL